MIQLPNNCRAGNISVYPENWKTSKASVKSYWHISYWFYDDNLKQKKKIEIKGMNHFPTAAQRREAVQLLIDDEIDLITRQGYNRITKTYSNTDTAEITGFTPFLDALEYVFSRLKVENDTLIDIRSTLKYFKESAIQLGYERLPIKDISQKHIKLTLDNCENVKKNTTIKLSSTTSKQGTWSANQFNHYRKYISLLFKQLTELTVINYNPVTYVTKMKALKVIRETLTPDQRKTVNGYLHEYHYNFWRFLQIFFLFMP